MYKTQITQQILLDTEELPACGSFSSFALKQRAAYPENLIVFTITSMASVTRRLQHATRWHCAHVHTWRDLHNPKVHRHYNKHRSPRLFTPVTSLQPITPPRYSPVLIMSASTTYHELCIAWISGTRVSHIRTACLSYGNHPSL